MKTTAFDSELRRAAAMCALLLALDRRVRPAGPHDPAGQKRSPYLPNKSP